MKVTILTAGVLVFAIMNTPAMAVERTGTEVSELAVRAADDPSALESLRSTTSVDGQPVDLAAALDADETELAHRLEALATDGQTFSKEEAGAAVAEILAQPKYQGSARSDIPWYQRLLYRIGEWLFRLAGQIGEPWVAGAVAMGLVVATSVLVAIHLGRRRSREVEARLAIERALAKGSDPAQLERAAKAAAGEANFAEAIRLRFVAGLLRLDQAVRITFSPGTPNIEYVLALASPVFEKLAAEFDRVVYGGETATHTDLEEALAGWRTLLTEAKI